MAGATANYNPDGTLNIEYYRNATLDIIEREAEKRELNPNKIPNQYITGILRVCYRSLFEPQQRERSKGNGAEACNIEYNERNISDLFNVYLGVMDECGTIPSMFGFYRYSGISEDALEHYVTGARSLATKTRKNYIQNKLADTPIGNITLANNDIDTGLNYSRQNMIAHETVKKALDFADIVKLAQKQAGSETAGAIGMTDE